MKYGIKPGNNKLKAARNMAITSYLILLTVFMLISASAPASADSWWNTSWQYLRPIVINSSSNLTDYQIAINITNATNMNSTFQDIRFTAADNVTVLPYWIESYASGSWAYVWIKGNFTTLNGTQLYLWYGNPSATSQSNGAAVFTFFEDFSSGVITQGDIWFKYYDNNFGTSSNLWSTDVTNPYSVKVQSGGSVDGAITRAINVNNTRIVVDANLTQKGSFGELYTDATAQTILSNVG